MLLAKKMLMGGGEPSPVEIYGVQYTDQFPSHNSTIVYSNATLGTAHSDREIWVVVASMAYSDQGPSAAQVTLDGNSASKVFQHLPGGYYSNVAISYWKYTDDGILGSSPRIKVKFANIREHTGLIVFTANKTSSLLDSHADDHESASPATGSINTSKKGWSFYCAMCQNASSATIANFGNDGSFDAGSGGWVTYGYNSPEDDGTVSVGLPSSTGTDSAAISSISVEPAA